MGCGNSKDEKQKKDQKEDQKKDVKVQGSGGKEPHDAHGPVKSTTPLAAEHPCEEIHDVAEDAPRAEHANAHSDTVPLSVERADSKASTSSASRHDTEPNEPAPPAAVPPLNLSNVAPPTPQSTVMPSVRQRRESTSAARSASPRSARKLVPPEIYAKKMREVKAQDEEEGNAASRTTTRSRSPRVVKSMPERCRSRSATPRRVAAEPATSVAPAVSENTTAPAEPTMTGAESATCTTNAARDVELAPAHITVSATPEPRRPSCAPSTRLAIPPPLLADPEESRRLSQRDTYTTIDLDEPMEEEDRLRSVTPLPEKQERYEAEQQQQQQRRRSSRGGAAPTRTMNNTQSVSFAPAASEDKRDRDGHTEPASHTARPHEGTSKDTPSRVPQQQLQQQQQQQQQRAAAPSTAAPTSTRSAPAGQDNARSSTTAGHRPITPTRRPTANGAAPSSAHAAAPPSRGGERQPFALGANANNRHNKAAEASPSASAAAPRSLDAVPARTDKAPTPLLKASTASTTGPRSVTSTAKPASSRSSKTPVKTASPKKSTQTTTATTMNAPVPAASVQVEQAPQTHLGESETPALHETSYADRTAETEGVEYSEIPTVAAEQAEAAMNGMHTPPRERGVQEAPASAETPLDRGVPQEDIDESAPRAADGESPAPRTPQPSRSLSDGVNGETQMTTTNGDAAKGEWRVMKPMPQPHNRLKLLHDAQTVYQLKDITML